MKLFLLAALTSLALAARPKKYKDQMVFLVPEFHASEFGMRNPNPDPIAPNKSINRTFPSSTSPPLKVYQLTFFLL